MSPHIVTYEINDNKFLLILANFSLSRKHRDGVHLNRTKHRNRTSLYPKPLRHKNLLITEIFEKKTPFSSIITFDLECSVASTVPLPPRHSKQQNQPLPQLLAPKQPAATTELSAPHATPTEHREHVRSAHSRSLASQHQTTATTEPLGRQQRFRLHFFLVVAASTRRELGGWSGCRKRAGMTPAGRLLVLLSSLFVGAPLFSSGSGVWCLSRWPEAARR